MIGRYVFSGGKTITQVMDPLTSLVLKSVRRTSPSLMQTDASKFRVSFKVLCSIYLRSVSMDEFIKASGDTGTVFDRHAQSQDTREQMKKELNISEKTSRMIPMSLKLRLSSIMRWCNLKKISKTKYCPTGNERIRPSGRG